MHWQADPHIQRILLAAPEWGMGYQMVKFTVDGSPRRGVALNADLIIDGDDGVAWGQLRLNGMSSMLRSAAGMGEMKDFLVLVRPGRYNALVAEPGRGPCGRWWGAMGATDAPAEQADGKAHFVRLSAFRDDKRIDPEGRRLLPGSYATTLLDYHSCVKCPDGPRGDDPNDRYALPGGLPVEWAFHIVPHAGDVLQKGRVQPNFGHRGGGEEAYFKDGTSPGSLLPDMPKPYGQ